MKSGLIVLLLLLIFAPEAKARVWTSRTGNSIQADFIAEKGDWIYLMKPNGKHLKIKISDLSDDDKTHIYYRLVKPMSEAERKERLKATDGDTWLKKNTGDKAEVEKKPAVTLTLEPIEEKTFVNAFEPAQAQGPDDSTENTATSEDTSREKQPEEKTSRARSKPAPKRTPDEKPKNPALLTNMNKEAISYYLIWLIPPFIIRYAILRQPIRHIYSLFISSGIIFFAMKTFKILSHEKADLIPLALVGVMAWGIMSSSERTKHLTEIAQIRRCPSCKKKIKIKLMEASSITNCPKCNEPLTLPKNNPTSA